jgi:hypothetical protein
MSRPSLDQYDIPLRPFGRRKPQRAFSTSSQNGDLADHPQLPDHDDGDDGDDDRVSADEAPLIRKDRVPLAHIGWGTNLAVRSI